MVTYHIEVKTADKLFAGTNDNVEIKFSGTKNGIAVNSRQSYESIEKIQWWWLFQWQSLILSSSVRLETSGLMIS